MTNVVKPSSLTTIGKTDDVVRCHLSVQLNGSTAIDWERPLGLREHARRRLIDSVRAPRREPRALGRVIQTHGVEPVPPRLDANGAFRVTSEKVAEPRYLAPGASMKLPR
jgi:hypothetical protein